MSRAASTVETWRSSFGASAPQPSANSLYASTSSSVSSCVVRGDVRPRVRVHLAAVQALDGLAAGHAARIDRHHVVPGADLLRVADARVLLEVADGRAARPARVDQERAEALAGAGGLLAGHREADVALGRFRVVERGLHGGALEAGDTAVAPAELLLVVRRQLGGRGLRQRGQGRRPAAAAAGPAASTRPRRSRRWRAARRRGTLWPGSGPAADAGPAVSAPCVHSASVTLRDGTDAVRGSRASFVLPRQPRADRGSGGSAAHPLTRPVLVRLTRSCGSRSCYSGDPASARLPPVRPPAARAGHAAPGALARAGTALPAALSPL